MTIVHKTFKIKYVKLEYIKPKYFISQGGGIYVPSDEVRTKWNHPSNQETAIEKSIRKLMND